MPAYIRVARAETLEVRERLFVDAARVFGGGPVWILRNHILPSVAPTMLTLASVNLAMDREHPVEVRDLEVLEQCLVDDAGTVDEQPGMAEGRNCDVVDVRRIRLGRDVAGNRNGLPAGNRDLVGYRLCTVEMEIIDEHGIAVLRQPGCDRAADAGSCTRDDG